MLKPAKKDPLPPCLPCFSQVKRYRDAREDNAVVAKLLPGEYYVSLHNEMITTVLGSCISACIYDLESGVGGMNHFMLPNLEDSAKWQGTEVNDAARYGNYAMENLINEILKNGGRRSNLKVKVFGGGRIISNMAHIGLKNTSFAMEFLKREQLQICARDTGDIFPRKVNFYPGTGRVMVKKLKSLHNKTIFQRECAYKYEIEHTPVAGAVELF